MKQSLRDAIHERSGGRCEAETERGHDVWVRCSSPATEIHHLLPRSRGGKVLDEWGETNHLIHLCSTDHRLAHSRKHAEGMMIDGSCRWDKLRNKPRYQGTDPYLKMKYPAIGG